MKKEPRYIATQEFESYDENLNDCTYRVGDPVPAMVVADMWAEAGGTASRVPLPVRKVK